MQAACCGQARISRTDHHIFCPHRSPRLRAGLAFWQQRIPSARIVIIRQLCISHRQSLSGALVGYFCTSYIGPSQAEPAIIALARFIFKILSTCSEKL
jgi:Na+/melibiose symporter-like transporter